MGCPGGCRFEAISVAPSYTGMHGIPCVWGWGVGGGGVGGCCLLIIAAVLPLDPLNNETSALLLCN